MCSSWWAVFHWLSNPAWKSHCITTEVEANCSRTRSLGASGYRWHQTDSPYQSVVARLGERCREILQPLSWLPVSGQAWVSGATASYHTTRGTLARCRSWFPWSDAHWWIHIGRSWLLQQILRDRYNEVNHKWEDHSRVTDHLRPPRATQVTEEWQWTPVRQYLADHGIVHHRVTPLWPQANGEVERQNASIEKRLKIAAEEGKDWREELITYLAAYRAASQSSQTVIWSWDTQQATYRGGNTGSWGAGPRCWDQRMWQTLCRWTPSRSWVEYQARGWGPCKSESDQQTQYSVQFSAS